MAALKSPVPKRIVMVGSMYPYRGGIAHFLETMYQGLGRRGHKALPVTFTRQYPEFLFPGKTQYETAEVDDPIPARRLIDTVGPWSWFEAAQEILRFKPDAIVFQYWMPFFAPAYGTLLWLLRRRGVRGYAVVHNAIPHERRIGDHALGRFFLGQCDGLIALSNPVQRDIKSLGAQAPVRRVHHPIYDIFGEGISKARARELLGYDSDTPLLLFFGYVRKYKGLQVAIDAMPKILEQLPNARLLICGEFYEGEAEYRASIDRLGIADHVDIHADYVPNNEVAHWFCACDLVVQPYVSATQSGVAQIAYQFERPSIISDVGGLAEVVPHEEAGFVVEAGKPAKFAAAITRYFTEDWASRFAAGIQKERLKYSWDRLYEALEELMDM